MNATKHRPTSGDASTANAAPWPDLRTDARWQVDRDRSTVGFSVRKLGTMTVRGTFAPARGELVAAAGTLAASGAVTVDSLTTGDPGRDAHLLDFFAADTYPEISFRSQSIQRLDGHRLVIRGPLTIRDRAREITLIADPASDGLRLRLRGELDRRDFGLTWSRAIEASGAVANRIELDLDVALVRA